MKKSLKKQVKRLEEICLDLNQEITSRYMYQRSVERILVDKIACGAVGHKFSLRWVILKEKDELRETVGKFECTECFLKIKRPLTNEEFVAARKLGMIEGVKTFEGGERDD